MLGSNTDRRFAAAARGGEVAAGISRIELPTPWPVGPVNTYLIDDDPLTLVDTGPIHRPTLTALERALAARGRRVEDLERIVITHQHPDHWGLAQVLVERSNAELCALDELGAWLADYPASLAREERFANAILAHHGGDPAVSSGIYADDISFAAAVQVTHPLSDGAVLEFGGRRLRVLHRPGHSRSDTVFHDERRGMMIAGDHVLSRRSVPMLSPPLVGPIDAGRYRALATYKASLLVTRALQPELILPGHGDPLHDPRAIIDRHLGRFAAAAARVGTVIDRRPRAALELAVLARGEIAPEQAFFAISETLGYLDELLDAGGVVEGETGGVTWFQAT